MAFDHERLDAYQRAIEFVANANSIVERLPRGRGYLADQLQRAALSIVLNIAEGAGKFSSADKAVFYMRARGSATESAAVLDVCRKLNLLPEPLVDDNKAILERADAHEADQVAATHRITTSPRPRPRPAFDSPSTK